MSKRSDNDPRWAGVELPSLWRVLVRVHGEDEASDHYPDAVRAIAETGRYGEWHAVFNGFGQVLGYKRLNPKEWFTFGKDDGKLNGPFPTKRLALATQRLKSARTVEAGVYETDDHYFFTRDRAERVNVKPEELP